MMLIKMLGSPAQPSYSAAGGHSRVSGLYSGFAQTTPQRRQSPHLWGCLKLELRGHLVLVQFHGGCDAADAHIRAVVVVSP
jgi:hypothetical protein